MDPSQTLLNVGKEKGLFKATFCCYVSHEEETPVESGKQD
jgi:hypothetical protein